MVDAAFGAAPTENAVAENQLHALGFTVDAAIEGVKGFEDFHRGTSRLFALGPFLARSLPTLQSSQPRWLVGEIGSAGFSVMVRLSPGNTYRRLVGWVVPSGFEPRGNSG